MVRVMAAVALSWNQLVAQLPWQITPMARAVATYSHADPVPGGKSLGEFALTQPTLMVDVRYGKTWALALIPEP